MSYTGNTGSWTTASFDSDGNPGNFNQDEQNTIRSIWQRVAEDYAPFNVNVTTQDPGDAAINRDNASDTNFGVRVVITRDNTIYNACYGCGGVAYVGIFDFQPNSYIVQPAWVLQNGLYSNTKNLAEAVSHETGHTLGLYHDGLTNGTEYYLGQGAWAPIMGLGYTKPVTQWSNGSYTNASNTENDFEIIQSNGLSIVPDDHGNSIFGATRITENIGISGIIATSNDVDMFEYTTTGGTKGFAVSNDPIHPNLDVKLELLNSSGTVIATSNPETVALDYYTTTGMEASLEQNLTAGTYYIRVDGTGNGSPNETGYSDYGSVGRYDIYVTNGLPTVTPTTLPEASFNTTYTGQLTGTGGRTPYTWSFVNGNLPPGLTINSDGTFTGAVGGYDSPQTFTFNVQMKDANGTKITTPVTLPVTFPAPTITITTIPYLSQNNPSTVNLTALYGSGQYSWATTSGSLPPGITLSNSTLTGTPTTAGTYTFALTVTDLVTGKTSAPQTFTAEVTGNGGGGGGTPTPTPTPTPSSSDPTTPPVTPTPTSSSSDPTTPPVSTPPPAPPANPAVTIVTSSLPAGATGVSYATTLTATGGNNNYNWAITSNRLPNGLTLTSNGTLHGTPSEAGTFTFLITVSDTAGGRGMATFTIQISESVTPPTPPTPPTPDPVKVKIKTKKLPKGSRKTSYHASIVATPSNVTFGVSSGTLPANLNLTRKGKINGKPKKAGTYRFTVTATHSSGATAQKSFVIKINK